MSATDRPSGLEARSGVSQSGEGFVTLRWGAQAGQLTAAECRDLAMDLLEGANAAQFDAAVVRGLREAGADDDLIGRLLEIVRESRAA